MPRPSKDPMALILDIAQQGKAKAEASIAKYQQEFSKFEGLLRTLGGPVKRRKRRKNSAKRGRPPKNGRRKKK